jgi:hypothetical protein
MYQKFKTIVDFKFSRMLALSHRLQGIGQEPTKYTWVGFTPGGCADQGPFSQTWIVRFEADAKGFSIAEGGD